MRAVTRICFVCTGNICRSPAAEVVVRALAGRPGSPAVEVDSAGTDGWHVGDPADRRAVRALGAAGYDGRPHRARQFEPDWFAERDLVVALDRGHARILRSWAPDDEARAKIRLLRSFDPAAGPDQDVADPYYDGDEAFTVMVGQIEVAAAGLLDHLRPRD